MTQLTETEVFAVCVPSATLHVRLLNTFAHLENIGARKIHRFQRFGLGGDFVLKHAAEEARHAWHFKQQTYSLTGGPTTDLLGGHASRSYLRRLDLATNRYLRDELHLAPREQYLAAYLLVTFVIELRANALYPAYAQVLKAHGSPVRVQSVINEEKQHLAEMHDLLLPVLGERLDATVSTLVKVEEALYAKWLTATSLDLESVAPSDISS